MRRFICSLIFTAGLISLNAGLSGCSDSKENKVLDYDPKVSEKKSEEYRKQMEEGLSKNKPAQQ